MLKGILLVTGLALLASGAEGLFHAASNRRQTTVSCHVFAQSPPQAKWLRVTGCEMSYMGAGFRESGGRIVELYFPARPAGRPETEPAPIVATTRDPSALALAEETIGAGRTPDQEQYLVMMLKIVTALRASREIEGYASAGILDRLRSRRAVAGLSTPLSPDVVVVDLHAKPGYVVPGAAAAAAVLLLGLVAVLRSKRRAMSVSAPSAPRDAAAREPPATVEVAGGSADQATAHERESSDQSAMRLRVMLLDVPPEVGVEAVEDAPPLGSRESVISAIGRNVSGLRFDASGHAAIRRADFELRVDIGPADPVYTVVLDAQGAAALPLVARILERTTWRAFEAKAGRFISVDQLDEYAASPAGHTAA